MGNKLAYKIDYTYSYEVDEALAELLNYKALLYDEFPQFFSEETNAFEDILSRLLAKKRELIKKESQDEDQGGLYNKYTIINNKTGEIENGCFVLNPLKDTSAREALTAYANSTSNTVLAREIHEWVDEFGKYACISPKRKPCSRVGSPVCCMHCPIRNLCFDESSDRMCNYARFGDVVDIDDCKEQGLL